MTRSVADSALLDRVVTGSALAVGGEPEGPAARRAARSFLGAARPRVARLMEGTLAVLKEAGAVLVEGDIADVGRLDNEAGFPIALLRDRRRPERLPRDAWLADEIPGAGRAVREP
jgi:mandelamide amidase